MTFKKILDEVYGETEWSESALVSILRVMELTRQDEKIKQMNNLIDHQNMVLDNIINMLQIQHEASKEKHNYWLAAAKLIEAEFRPNMTWPFPTHPLPTPKNDKPPKFNPDNYEDAPV